MKHALLCYLHSFAEVNAIHVFHFQYNYFISFGREGNVDGREERVKGGEMTVT